VGAHARRTLTARSGAARAAVGSRGAARSRHANPQAAQPRNARPPAAAGTTPDLRSRRGGAAVRLAGAGGEAALRRALDPRGGVPARGVVRGAAGARGRPCDSHARHAPPDERSGLRRAPGVPGASTDTGDGRARRPGRWSRGREGVAGCPRLARGAATYVQRATSVAGGSVPARQRPGAPLQRPSPASARDDSYGEPVGVPAGRRLHTRRCLARRAARNGWRARAPRAALPRGLRPRHGGGRADLVRPHGDQARSGAAAAAACF
jgi:hypothetical protein